LTKKKFEIISKAPARVCLFGDHQDYLNLPVIACAIDRFIEIKANKNNSNFLKIYKTDLNEIEKININDPLENIENEDYLKLALKVLKRYNCKLTHGYDIYISGNIPINAGLSSSSALTVAWIQFLIFAYKINIPISKLILSKLAYETEVIEQGSSGGKMDQYTISHGKTIFLNTLNDKIKIFSEPINYLIIGVSGESKDTLGMLSSLKSKTWEAINKVKSKVLDFDPKNIDLKKINLYLKILDVKLQPFLEAAIINYKITQKAKKEFLKKNFKNQIIGELMNHHHKLLKENLKITTPKIDLMIDASLTSGAFGAKIIGSGGGGCIAVLSNKKNVNQIITNLKKAGAIDAFEVNVSNGPELYVN